MGKIFCFGSDVDTDQIIASQYLLYPSVEEMAPHCFESLDENFATAVQAGDFVVARDNFGCGSSREQAPAVLKALGVRAVFANSFARIFFRNAINIGLPVIVCENLIEHVNCRSTSRTAQSRWADRITAAPSCRRRCRKFWTGADSLRR